MLTDSPGVFYPSLSLLYMYGRDARDRFFIFHTTIARQRYLFIAPYTRGKSGSRKINYERTLHFTGVSEISAVPSSKKWVT